MAERDNCLFICYNLVSNETFMFMRSTMTCVVNGCLGG